MSYKAYEKPSLAGITFASGTFTQQPAYDGVLSYQADAQAYADAIGAKLLNALNTPATNFTFGGIKPTDAAQPWMVTWDGASFFFAGIAINQQVAATKALIGLATSEYPGTWARESSGVWDFTPQPLAPVPAPAPATSNSAADVAGWEAAMNLPTVTLSDVMKALAAIGVAVGAKSPTS